MKFDEDYTKRWIVLYKKASIQLTPERFKLWLYGVGLEGNYKQRFKVGKAILETMSPSHSMIHVKISANDNASGVLREFSDAIAEAIRP